MCARCQVVHADMKTKNVLLSAGRMTAKIADVGLARFMAQTHMDTKSLPMGTFVYAAPELLLGKRSDHKVCRRRQLHERPAPQQSRGRDVYEEELSTPSATAATRWQNNKIAQYTRCSTCL